MEEAVEARDKALAALVTGDPQAMAKIQVQSEEGTLEDARNYRAMRGAADKWWAAEENILSVLRQELKMPVHPPTAMRKFDPHRTVVASTSDLHFGKRVWNSTKGVVYNQEIARERLMSTSYQLSCQMRQMELDEAVLVIGGDDLHIDTYDAATTRKTVQDMDGTPDEIIAGYLPTIIPWINFWREKVEADGVINVIVTPGNHNRILAQAMGIAVGAFYKDEMRMQVDYRPDPRKYLRIGNNLFGFTHGERGKPHDLSSHMAIEAAHLWGISRHRFMFVQHEHHDQVKDANGVTFFRNPTLGNPDRWHENNLFAASTLGATAYTFGDDGSYTHHFVKG